MKNSRVSPRPSAKAFSLIELTVVLAILAVLIVVGISVSGSFARKSRDIGCVSNLRSLHQGFLYYLSDYGTLPFGVPTPKSDWEIDYFQRQGGESAFINASYYSGIHARRMRDYLPGGNNANTGYAAPYLCPADREPRGNYTAGFLGHSYGFNMTIARDRNGMNYNRPTTWTHPAETFLLADSKRDILARTVPNTNLAPRHEGKANTLFLDGHVETIPAPFPTWQENRRFWVPDHED